MKFLTITLTISLGQVGAVQDTVLITIDGEGVFEAALKTGGVARTRATILS